MKNVNKEMNKKADLFRKIKQELFTAVVGDVMDSMGLIKQFLPPKIKPLHEEMIVVGRALTVHEKDIDLLDEDTPFGLMFDALDDLKKDEVYLTSGASNAYALWGGLMSTRAMKLKSAGAVLNGYHRDTQEIIELMFPVFSWGSYAQDQKGRGKVIDYRCVLEFQNGVVVNPGDIVFGDIDGVVIIPKDIETEVVMAALEKVSGENKVREAIESGISAKAAYKKYGVM
jgi:regulator of RNase E activity RraA